MSVLLFTSLMFLFCSILVVVLLFLAAKTAGESDE